MKSEVIRMSQESSWASLLPCFTDNVSALMSRTIRIYIKYVIIIALAMLDSNERGIRYE